MKRHLLCLSPLALLYLPASALAQTPAQLLSQYLHGFNTYSAKFIQSNAGKKISGEIKIKKPNAIYWAVNGAMPQTVISNGKTLWIYNKALAQVTQKKLDNKAMLTPALLLTGSSKVLSNYFTVATPTIFGATIRFAIKPKAVQTSFEAINLSFHHKVLTKITMVNNLGQHVEYDFNSIQLNQPLANHWFNFVAPKGVDVMRG